MDNCCNFWFSCIFWTRTLSSRTVTSDNPHDSDVNVRLLFWSLKWEMSPLVISSRWSTFWTSISEIQVKYEPHEKILSYQMLTPIQLSIDVFWGDWKEFLPEVDFVLGFLKKCPKISIIFLCIWPRFFCDTCHIMHTTSDQFRIIPSHYVWFRSCPSPSILFFSQYLGDFFYISEWLIKYISCPNKGSTQEASRWWHWSFAYNVSVNL